MSSTYGQCFCGDGGNITCQQLQSESNSNSKLKLHTSTTMNGNKFH